MGHQNRQKGGPRGVHHETLERRRSRKVEDGYDGGRER